MANFVIEVMTKQGYKNPHAEHVSHDINELGLLKEVEVKYAPIYSFDGDISAGEARRISEKLLTDPVTEDYVLTGGKPSKDYMHIEVWLKNGVTDTVAQSIVKGVKDLGINKTLTVKTGHSYYLKGKIKKEVAEEIANRLLFNPIIQVFRIN